MSTDKLNLIVAVAAAVFALVALVISFWTLRYMRGRDHEVDTRAGWAEIHKAMVAERVQRAYYLIARQEGDDSPLSNQELERFREHDLANEQLRGQLERVNDDPLVETLKELLLANRTIDSLRSSGFTKTFNEIFQKVAIKARPR
jgi:hypothetical protein